MKKETKKKLLIGGSALLAVGCAYIIGRRKGRNEGIKTAGGLGFVVGQKFMHYAHTYAYSKEAGQEGRKALNDYCKNVLKTNNEEYQKFKQKDPAFWLKSK